MFKVRDEQQVGQMCVHVTMDKAPMASCATHEQAAHQLKKIKLHSGWRYKVDRRHKCDGCRISLLPGNWYRCNECTDFDFCADCFGKKSHPMSHDFTDMGELKQKVVADEERALKERRAREHVSQMETTERIFGELKTSGIVMSDLKFPSEYAHYPTSDVIATTFMGPLASMIPIERLIANNSDFSGSVMKMYLCMLDRVLDNLLSMKQSTCRAFLHSVGAHALDAMIGASDELLADLPAFLEFLRGIKDVADKMQGGYREDAISMVCAYVMARVGTVGSERCFVFEVTDIIDGRTIGIKSDKRGQFCIFLPASVTVDSLNISKGDSVALPDILCPLFNNEFQSKLCDSHKFPLDSGAVGSLRATSCQFGVLDGLGHIDGEHPIGALMFEYELVVARGGPSIQKGEPIDAIALPKDSALVASDENGHLFTLVTPVTCRKIIENSQNIEHKVTFEDVMSMSEKQCAVRSCLGLFEKQI
jgi:hypothetical protein